MRVSKLFKAIAAPLLYEKLDWKHMKREPLRLIKEGKGEVIRRGALDLVTKETELQYIKSIEIQAHSQHDCPLPSGRTRQSPLKVPILRILMDGNGYQRSTRCIEQRLCPVSRGVIAKKLVIIPAEYCGQIHLDRSNDGMVQDHVVKTELFQHPNQSVHLHLKSKAKRLIVILARFSRDYSFCSFYPIPYFLEHLARLLARSRRYRYSPQDIVLVNFAQLDAKHFTPTSHPGGTFEAYHDRVDTQFQTENWMLEAGDEWRTPAELALVSTKFITMKEYLTEYDWDGVYTENEVAELLKEQPSEG